MIEKENEVPIIIRKLEALLRRLPIDHPTRSKVESEYAKCCAGFRGEESLVYHLKLLDMHEYHIFHKVRLPYSKEDYFQMDILILTLRFFLIIEVKNITGTLYFDQHFHQLIRKVLDKEEVFPDPISQVKRQVIQLKAWLKNNRFSEVPVEGFIVISNPSTFIKTTDSSNNPQNVFHAAALPAKIDQMSKKFFNKLINQKELLKISKFILKQNSDMNPDVLNRFQLFNQDIITGVFCKKCMSNMMSRSKKGWICLECKHIDRYAHIYALLDYLLLISPVISNQQTRWFWGISSESSTRKLLVSLELSKSGTKKRTMYHLNYSSLNNALSSIKPSP